MLKYGVVVCRRRLHQARSSAGTPSEDSEFAPSGEEASKDESDDDQDSDETDADLAGEEDDADNDQYEQRLKRHRCCQTHPCTPTASLCGTQSDPFPRLIPELSTVSPQQPAAARPVPWPVPRPLLRACPSAAGCHRQVKCGGETNALVRPEHWSWADGAIAGSLQLHTSFISNANTWSGQMLTCSLAIPIWPLVCLLCRSAS